MDNSVSLGGETQRNVNEGSKAGGAFMYSLTRTTVGEAVDALGSSGNTIRDTGHSVLKNNWVLFTSGPLINQEFQVTEVVDVNNFKIDSKLPDSLLPNSASYDIYRNIIPKTDSSGSFLTTGGDFQIVDFLDVGTYIPSAAGDGVIPRSSNNATQVVASLAAAVTRIQSVSDVGEFINIYLDAARTQLVAHMTLTPDEEVDVNIPAGSSIFLGHAKDVDIDDANSVIQLNFIG